MTEEQIDNLANEIVESWARWEGEAMNAAQVEQDAEEHTAELLRQVRAAIRKHAGGRTETHYGKRCTKCNREMVHYRLGGYRCPVCH